MGKRWPIAAVVAALVAAASACGVATDSSDRPFEVDLLPGVAAPVTSIVSTVPPVGLTLPTGSTLSLPTVLGGPPSTQPLYPLRVFFISSGALFPAARPLPGEPTLADVDRLLRAGPGPNEVNMVALNLVGTGVVQALGVADGVARFELLPGFSTYNGEQQVLMAGQIVLSTRIPGVGQVAFERDGERVDILTADGRLAPQVTPADYADLVIGGRLAPMVSAPPPIGTALSAPVVPLDSDSVIGGVDVFDDPSVIGPVSAGSTAAPVPAAASVGPTSTLP